jgi:hypothetical protein
MALVPFFSAELRDKGVELLRRHDIVAAPFQGKGFSMVSRLSLADGDEERARSLLIEAGLLTRHVA